VPIPLGKVAKGGVVAIGSSARGPGGDPQIFAVEKLEFLMRLDAVEWWTKSPTSRDYARAWLASGGDERGARSKAKAACAEALVYVQRKTGEVFLQGWYE
jgi:protein ImuB